MNGQELLAELQPLTKVEPADALPRLRTLADELQPALEADRRSQAGISLALAHQALNYLYEGIVAEENAPEIKRRFAIAIRRAEGWAMASARANPDDPRLHRGIDTGTKTQGGEQQAEGGLNWPFREGDEATPTEGEAG